MTPREALQVLDQVTAGVPLSRKQHAQCSEAVMVLAKVLAELDEKKSTE